MQGYEHEVLGNGPDPVAEIPADDERFRCRYSQRVCDDVEAELRWRRLLVEAQPRCSGHRQDSGKRPAFRNELTGRSSLGGQDRHGMPSRRSACSLLSNVRPDSETAWSSLNGRGRDVALPRTKVRNGCRRVRRGRLGRPKFANTAVGDIRRIHIHLPALPECDADRNGGITFAPPGCQPRSHSLGTGPLQSVSSWALNLPLLAPKNDTSKAQSL